MKLLLLLLVLTNLFFYSCAPLNYLYEQGVGQLGLLNRAIANEEILKSPLVSASDKEKLKLISEYKKYFYEYFQKKSTAIYSKTTILKNPAVTYLVIASPYNEIKAIDNCLFFIGCFPYLGFFNLQSAKDFASKKESQELSTFLRPVYAYSTLGFFNDPILSSFFHFDDYELAELIFHELFHTLFFIPSEIEVNENLANFYGEKMAEEYFLKKGLLDLNMAENEKRKQIKAKILNLINQLNEHYLALQPKNKSESEIILNEFLTGVFYPNLQELCQKINGECQFIKATKWNNARFAAFLTYEKKQNMMEEWQKRKKISLREMYSLIESKYLEFKNRKKEDQSDDFIRFLTSEK